MKWKNVEKILFSNSNYVYVFMLINIILVDLSRISLAAGINAEL